MFTKYATTIVMAASLMMYVTAANNCSSVKGRFTQKHHHSKFEKRVAHDEHTILFHNND